MIMKANELQVGNWVRLNDPLQSGYAQVIGYFNGMVATKSETISAKVRIEDVKPIPITKEWTAKNGFKRFYDDICEFTYYTKEIDGHFVDVNFDCSNTSEDNVICHIDNCDRMSVANADMQYVHQLQNLLNLVGINSEFVV